MSEDIEDRRDSSGGDGGGPGFSFGGMGGGGLGIVGFLVLLVISLVTGRNFIGGLLSGGGAGQGSTQTAPRIPRAAPRPHPAGEDRDAHLVSFVLDDAQKTWTQIFASQHRQYRHAKLVLYRGTTYSGCGTARATTGPFYCPQDEKIYIDLGFWDELRRFGGDTGDFAQAYVITHELGHHVQKLLGIESRMTRLAQQDPSERNPLSVDLELQADCFAGVWAHSTEQRNIVHSNDIAGALKAAAAVGDDHLQRMSGRAVSPESFTHGTSAERKEWFTRGLEGGTIQSCPTFNGKLAP
jgi:predicted metalloprotease